MNIIHIIPYFQPSYGYEEYYHALGHHRLGANVTVITSKYYHPNLKAKLTKTTTSEDQGVPFTVIRLRSIEFNRSAQNILIGLSGAVISTNPDAIYLHGPECIAYLFISDAMKKRIPTLIDVHKDGAEKIDLNSNFIKSLTSKIKKIVIKLNMRFIHRILFFSESHRLAYISQFDADVARRSMTLFMGVDTSVFFVDENKRKAMRSELGLSDSDTLVILSGRLTRAKKIHEIVGCLKDLAQEDIYFVFVGHIDQGYFQEIIGTCGELLSAKKFRFIPPLSRERLAEIYNASDFALWPFHMSVGILEAMSCGATVLTNKEAKDYYESIPESAVIDDGLNGFVNRILIGHKLDNLEDRKRNRELNARSMSSLSYDHLARRTMSLLRCENIGSI